MRFWLLLSVAAFWCHSASAQQADWEKEWNRIVAHAQKEGRVVVAGPANPTARVEIPAKFKERFGISVEWISGGTRGLVERLRLEHKAGLSTFDVFLGGSSTVATVLYPEKMIDPIRPLLLLPDVVDGSKWKPGKLWFTDPEERYILRVFSTVREILHINTNLVKREDLKTVEDLKRHMLNPAWKGKISIAPPGDAGTGSNTAAQFLARLGDDFAKKFFVDHKPVVLRDARQAADSLARGVHPISLGARQEDIARMQAEGLPVATIYGLSGWTGTVASGSGHVVLIRNAPNPNAARVFINWLASKEGLELYARSNQSAPTRNDIDESFLPPEVIPNPNMTYVDGASWEFTTKERDEVKAYFNEIMK